MVTTARQFIGGDFGDIFDQAFFSQGGEGDLSAEIIAVSATLLRVRNESDPSRTTDLVGSGFAVSTGPDPMPTAGTITEFRFFRGDTLLGTLASGPIGAVAFASALAADDNGDPTPLDNLFLNEPFRLDAAQANDRVRFEVDDDDDDGAPRAPFGDTLIGSAFDDTLEGDAGADLIQAGAGRRDRLFGGPGADTLDGGEGTGDELRYGLEGGPRGVFVNLITNRAIDTFGDTDVLIGIERAAGTALDDTMIGDDASNVFRSRGGNDVFNGGGGFDRINYFGAPGGVAVNLATGVALNGFGGTDRLTSVEDVTGSNFGDDTIVGSDADNFLEGFDGADTYDGRGGFDTVDYSSEHNDGGRGASSST